MHNNEVPNTAALQTTFSNWHVDFNMNVSFTEPVAKHNILSLVEIDLIEQMFLIVTVIPEILQLQQLQT